MFCKINNIQKSPLMQEKSFGGKNPQKKSIFRHFKSLENPVLESSIESNPEQWAMSLTKKQLSMLNDIFNNALRFPISYFSQDKVAERCDMSRERVNRLINAQYVPLGILSKSKQIALYETCVYKISPFFLRKDIQERLSHWFPCFRFLKVLLLLSMTMGSLSGNVTQYNNYRNIKNIYINTLDYKEVNKNYLKGDLVYQDALGPKNQDVYINMMRAEIKNQSQRLALLHKNNTDSVISTEIKKITPILNLSKWGQISLSRFPDAAIAFASQKLAKARYLRNPFAWFFGVCSAFCQDKGIRIDSKFSYLLGRYFGYKKNAKMTLKSSNVCNENKDYNSIVNNFAYADPFPELRDRNPHVCNVSIITNRHKWEKLQTSKIHTENITTIPLRAEYNPGQYEPGFARKNESYSILKSLLNVATGSVSGFKSLGSIIMPKKEVSVEQQEEDMKLDIQFVYRYRTKLGETLEEAYQKYTTNTFIALVGKDVFDKFMKIRRIIS